MIKDPEWLKFTEVFYRRNVIVHNDGYSDKEYLEKTGKSIDVNVDLSPTDEYIQESLDIFRKFGEKTMKFFKKKYPKKIKKT